MFLYGQAEKLTERIDTPIGPLFIREAGFGFGKNYTLSAIAGADQAKTPQELVKVLDELSKVQGNLTTFAAWTPQFKKDALTFALRGMISMTATSLSSDAYDEDGEKVVSNPLLMDVVLALRTDLTFFVNVRAWIATNYHDWFVAPANAEFKRRPTLRGYLYFSVPRKELLARFVSDPTGVIGKHPELPEPLVRAIKGTRFSATLYIRPGLYHMEFGWPYELGFELGKPSENFYLSLSGGLVFRIEDATALYGIAFKASGKIEFGGKIGNANFGASAVARADFTVAARFIAYLAPLKPKDMLFYGEIFLNLSLRFSVSIWMSFKIFRKRFTLRIGFTISLTISISAEVVLSGDGLGARVFACVGVRGFGRTLSVGVGFSFGDGALERARARVARFMQLGLGIDPPREETLLAPAPATEPARKERAKDADKALDRPPPPKLPDAPPPDPVEAPLVPGEPIGSTDFWAIILDAGKDDGGNDTYLVQFVPRDHSDTREANRATFYAEPWPVRLDETADPANSLLGAPAARVTPDYKFTANDAIPGLLHFDPATSEFKTINTDEIGLAVNLDRKVGDSEFGTLDLNAVLAECFLAHPDATSRVDYGFGEPFAITHAKPKAADGQSPRDARDAQASRFGASPSNKKLEASIVAEEKRSTIVNKIGESAFDLAAQARARTGQADDQRIKREKKELDFDCVDFGMTFLIPAASLVPSDTNTSGGTKTPLTLFKADGTANFNLQKRVGKYPHTLPPGDDEPSWEFVDCPVELLYRPSEAFDVEEPRLDAARVEKTADGFCLFWDLEPAFGSSAVMDFADDPETRLAFYEIERSFEGAEVPLTASFRTKSATTQKFEFVGNQVRTVRSRATMHLTDDLSQGGVPEELRALLFGTPLPKDRRAGDIWETAFGASRIATVVYKVTAVDIMGTRTGQRVLEYEVERPLRDVAPPLGAELTVAIANGLPALDAPSRPSVKLKLAFADNNALKNGKQSLYLLRVRAHELLGGGQYGADAVDDAKNRPGQADIDIKREGRDRDLYLVPDANGPVPVDMVVVDEAGVETDKTSEVKFSIKKRLDASSNNEPAEAILDALRIPRNGTTAADLRACQVFLKRIVRQGGLERSSTWLFVETLLRVTPQVSGSTSEAGEPFTAVVELLETPLALPFLALDQSQIEREAGRLEILYPLAYATLEQLATSGTIAAERRLDPDRRSAIRLQFNASGARLKKTGKEEVIVGEKRLAGLVAGYDVFSVDPARLRIRAGDGNAGLTADMVASEAQKRATVTVLPRSLAGTSPAALPNFRSVEVRYPSDTARTDPKRLQGRMRAPWYSAAESLLAFPRRVLRRSLLPVPEEALIAELLDERDVISICFALQAPTGLAAAPKEVRDTNEALRTMAMGVVTELAPSKLTPNTTSGEPPRMVKLADHFYESGGDPMGAAELRGLLRGLMLTPSDTVEKAYREWRRKGSPAYFAAAFRLRLEITATARNTPPHNVVVDVDLASTLHPALADALDDLSYVTDPDTGQVYRGYEVVREALPPLETEGFEAFLDARAPSADPYGWATLRSLGLAAGIRVYDVDEASFLKGSALFEHVDRAFRAALKRYGDVTPLGAAFVELVDLPDDFLGISSFDGRSARVGDDSNRLRDGDTSILQIGLRPHADRMTKPTPPVRYLSCRVDSSIGNKEAATLTFPNEAAALIDTVGLPLTEGAGTTRFATADAEAVLFGDNKRRFPGEAEIDYPRLAGLENGSVGFLLRVTKIGANFDFDAFRKVLTNRLGSGLVLRDWIDHPKPNDDTAVFDTFPPLDAPVLAHVLQQSNPDGDTPFNGFTDWLPPRHHPANQSAPLEWLDIGARFGSFTERFLRHGPALAPDTGQPAIGIAFAALTIEESYARTPDANGRVSTFFIDPTRIGQERYFAVRPFGRYADIEAKISQTGERPVTLDGGFGRDWRRHFAAVSLPRSKPLDPPAILSAALAKADGKRGTAAIELVVARTPDQIASTANIRAERALQGGWTGLELRATYSSVDLARAILKDPMYDPLDNFGAFGSNPGELDPMEACDLEALRERVPDAWRGAIRYELAGFPPFFDLTALVHQSAGVVVSDVVAYPLPKSDAILRLPPFTQRQPDGPLRAYEAARIPAWTFDYVTGEDKVAAVVSFDLPMVRNIDLMSDVDITAWTGNEPKHVGQIYRLPDPETSYRISAVSPDLASSAPLIDILPAKAPDGNASLYLAMLLAKSFESVSSEVTLAQQGNGAPWNWRLGVTAVVSSHRKAEIDTPTFEADGEAAFTAIPDDFDAESWATWAPARAFAFTIETADAAGFSALIDHLEPFAGAPGVDAMLAPLKDSPAAGDRIEGSLPLGLAVPDVSALSSNVEADGFEVSQEAARRITAAVARRGKRWAKNLPDDNPGRAARLITALRRPWYAERTPGKADLGPFYKAVQGLANPVEELAPPYAHFRTVRYHRTDGAFLKEADIIALIEALETAQSSDEFIRAAAMAILEATVAPVPEITIPIPVRDPVIAVDDLTAEETNVFYAGVHWPPDPGELARAPNETFGELAGRAIADAVFGPGTRPRMTAYRGNKPAVKEAITFVVPVEEQP